jgi:NAD(P)-dependent dehydrogenase (short-subunit alcohol dehydrogenase family)
MTAFLGLAGKVAIITGAGRGIGREIALTFAGAGAKVVINDIGASLKGEGLDASPADEVRGLIIERGGEAVLNTDSVSEWPSAQKIVQTALDSFGRVDIVVNNAGILRDKIMHQMDPADWDAVLKVHLYGSFT